MRRRSSSVASAGLIGSTATVWAHSATVRLVSWFRLVISTALPPLPGSSGRIWSASRTLSSTIITRRPASVRR